MAVPVACQRPVLVHPYFCGLPWVEEASPPVSSVCRYRIAGLGGSNPAEVRGAGPAVERAQVGLVVQVFVQGQSRHSPFRKGRLGAKRWIVVYGTVSYTHLTLPTIYSV